MRAVRAFLRLPAPGVLVLAALCAPVPACTVRLIAEYDERTEQEASRLEREMDLFLTRLSSKPATEATYEASGAFYDEHETDVRALRLRAEALPKNEISSRQLGKIEESVRELREAHRGKPLTKQAALVARDLFNISWKAILTLELAKKRA